MLPDDADPLVRRDLNETCSFREIERSITNFGEEERVDVFVVLKIFKDTETFVLCCATENEGFVQFLGIHVESVDVIREDDNFVAALFVVVDEELTGLKLLRVHGVE